jgi:hypothetical protein
MCYKRLFAGQNNAKATMKATTRRLLVALLAATLLNAVVRLFASNQAL